MNPLKLKGSTVPVTSANFQGLQTMSDTEIKNYIANVITTKFASDTNGSGTAELNVDTTNALSGTLIGTFADTDRTEATGTHPATGATTTTTYYVKQVTASATENITNRPVGYGTGIEELTDAEIRTDILDKVINAMVTESAYTAGQYKLAATAPSGGTWVARYTITDVANGGNTVTYLWQKTAATSSADANLKPLKVNGGSSIKEMSAAEIQQMVPYFRNRIISTSIGTYKLQSTAPNSGGTWVQMGDLFSDTREIVEPVNYTGSYTGSYTGGYTGTYSGGYTGNYSGNYTGNYTGPATYSGNYSGSYTGNYTGNYAGTGAYSGAYSGAYTGAYSTAFSGGYTGTYRMSYGGFLGTAYSGTYTGFYTGFFSGSYTGFYTGFYTGPATYSGTYSGAYSGTYTGFYTGTAVYSGVYSGTYSGTYTGFYSGTYTGFYSGAYSGTYSGNTVQATKETVSTVRLWIRTA